MTLPKISVVVPVYNVEKYLKKCLDSILNQTYKNLEIICSKHLKYLGTYYSENQDIKIYAFEKICCNNNSLEL